jgi:membrane protein involved in colicin uptake
MSESTKSGKARQLTVATVTTALIALVFFANEPARAGLFGGALGGAVIGGIIGGDDGAEAGAIIGGIAGASQASARRHEARRRHNQYRQQEAQRRRQIEEERLQLERERNELLRQQQQQQPVSQSADASLVKRTQSALTLLGFDIGNVNGQLDESTVTAIRSYQQSFGLLATGSPSQELLDHMKQQL